MAVDTREKRFSFLNFGDGAHFHATFEADGTVDLDDRQHLLDCYSGIAFGAAAAFDVYLTFPAFETTISGAITQTLDGWADTDAESTTWAAKAKESSIWTTTSPETTTWTDS